MRNYGDALKYQRDINDLSQLKLAQSTGLSQQAISLWESNKRIPSIENCEILADFYGITIDELIGRDSIKNNFNLDQRHNKGTINNNFDRYKYAR